jgi:hypothetical protein
MPGSYVRLAEHRSDMVRLGCTKCERWGQYRKATLIERYGPLQRQLGQMRGIELALFGSAKVRYARPVRPPPAPSPHLQSVAASSMTSTIARHAFGASRKLHERWCRDLSLCHIALYLT